MYLTGPIIALSQITAEDIHAFIELQDLEDGSYQLAPRVEVSSEDEISSSTNRKVSLNDPEEITLVG